MQSNTQLFRCALHANASMIRGSVPHDVDRVLRVAIAHPHQRQDRRVAIGPRIRLQVHIALAPDVHAEERHSLTQPRRFRANPESSSPLRPAKSQAAIAVDVGFVDEDEQSLVAALRAVHQWSHVANPAPSLHGIGASQQLLALLEGHADAMQCASKALSSRGLPATPLHLVL